MKVEYVPNLEPPEPNQRGIVVFGTYRVEFPDGLTVSMPHADFPGASQEPMGREAIIAQACRLRGAA